MPPGDLRRSAWFPVWAILHAFPLAFFTTALVSDLAFVNTAQMQWSNFSAWLIYGGLFIGGFAAAAALICGIFERRWMPRRRALVFAVLTIATWLVGLVNALAHSQDAWLSVVPLGLNLSIAATILVLLASIVGYSALWLRSVRHD